MTRSLRFWRFRAVPCLVPQDRFIRTLLPLSVILSTNLAMTPVAPPSRHGREGPPVARHVRHPGRPPIPGRFAGAAIPKRPAYRTIPSGRSSRVGLGKPSRRGTLSSRAGCQHTLSGLCPLNPTRPLGPGLSKCRLRAGGSRRICRAAMHGVNSRRRAVP